jgi:adenylosuccinate synthase
MTRHGAGPFVTETPELRSLFTDPYNVLNDWQQGFRVGPFDAVASRYAIELSDRPDLLAVSHLDQLAHAPETRIAVAYRYLGDDRDVQRYVDVEDGLIVRLRPSPFPEDLEYQERLTRIVERCEPVYRTVPGGIDPLLATVQDELGVPVGLVSSGPTFRDKAVFSSRPTAAIA